MDFEIVKVTLLALIQGLTEFLPISSSAHLILPSAILGWQDQGLAFDVAVHLGTLTAVVIYFRADLKRLFIAWIKNTRGHGSTQDSRLAWIILLATLPAVITGLLLKELAEQALRSVSVIAFMTVIFAILLFYSDLKSKSTRTIRDINWKTGLIIGLAQALALIPGTSRSGITMTAALFCNLDRESAARFSFLLSIPVIAGAALLLGVDLINSEMVNWDEIFYGFMVSGIVALICIHFFLKTIAVVGFLPFVVYRLILGTVLLLFFVP